MPAAVTAVAAPPLTGSSFVRPPHCIPPCCAPSIWPTMPVTCVEGNKFNLGRVRSQEQPPQTLARGEFHHRRLGVFFSVRAAHLPVLGGTAVDAGVLANIEVPFLVPAEAEGVGVGEQQHGRPSRGRRLAPPRSKPRAAQLTHRLSMHFSKQLDTILQGRKR